MSDKLNIIKLTPEQQLNYDKAKIGLLVHPNSIFITTILFSLRHVFTDSVDKVKTDGLNTYINPDWFDSLSPKQRMTALAEQAWHVAFRHMLRMGGRDQERWNRAADQVVGNLLQNNGFEMFDDSDIDSDYSNNSAEEVYEKLVTKEKNQGPPPPGGTGCGNDLAPPGQSPGQGDDNPETGNQPSQGDGTGTPQQNQEAAAQEIEQRISDMVSKGESTARMSGQEAGSIPGDILRELEELLNPLLPWNVILQNHMDSYKNEDYSMRKPNRRFFPDFHLPSLYSEGMGEVAIAIDTSGSVSDDDFLGFLTEVQSIKDGLLPSKMYVADFDTSIKAIAELEPDDDISKVEFHGGGGTSLFPVFEHFNKVAPEFLIVFSDLYCRAIPEDQKPAYPVYWVVVDNPDAEVNFGTVIHYSTEDLRKR